MILLEGILHTAIDPAFALLPPRMRSSKAIVMLFAITLQEADGVHRRQHGGGPAHGLWQFEEGGGVRGVMHHPMSRDWARTACAARGIPFDRHTIWETLARDDVLAATFARLLLWTDFKPLPEPDDMRGAWHYYNGLWRPGKPHPKKWPRCHRAARQQIFAPQRSRP